MKSLVMFVFGAFVGAAIAAGAIVHTVARQVEERTAKFQEQRQELLGQIEHTADEAEKQRSLAVERCGYRASATLQ
jgi:hypothetical protein